MIGIGEKFPSFSLKANVSTDPDSEKSFRTVTDLDYPGKWKVYFFWPKDYAVIAPTEIAAFGKLYEQFQERETQLVGGSIDSELVHRAWRDNDPNLKDVPFPLLADIKRELCNQLGILDPREGVPQRATFVVDPDGIIRFICVNDFAVGRSPAEILRVLDALQTNELCPSNWHKGEPTLKAA